MIETLIIAATSLAWLVAMFVPLERAFPARRGQRILRDAFATDLLFFFGQYLLFGALAATILATLVTPLHAVGGFVSEVREAFASRPLWLQIVLVVMAGDFVGYWGHRLQHRVEFLWRFHAVHHSSEEIDWLAAHREHPLDGLYTQAMVNLPAVLLGFDVAAVMGLVAFRSIWAIFIHANVRLPLGPLRYVVGSPLLHRQHHARARETGNYANLGPWVDVLFGTFVLPDEPPEDLGTLETMPRDYLGLLLAPFLPRR